MLAVALPEPLRLVVAKSYNKRSVFMAANSIAAARGLARTGRKPARGAGAPRCQMGYLRAGRVLALGQKGRGTLLPLHLWACFALLGPDEHHCPTAGTAHSGFAAQAIFIASPGQALGG